MSLTIEVKNVSKSFFIPHERRTTLKEHFVGIFNKPKYEKFEALINISFDVKQGEFLGIIGSNGSGKSTLLKILASIYNQDSGHVKVHGKLSPFLELGVGFNPELTGKENVYLNGTVLGLKTTQIDRRYKEIVEFSELENFMDMKVKNYSSGMFVRLAFSVAIQVDANILLMDEVLAVGDINFQEKCFTIFKKLKREGRTIILVSHSMANIEKFCDRVLLLNKGNLVGTGSPENMIYEYQLINMDKDEKRIEKENQQRSEHVKKVEKPIKIEDKTILTPQEVKRWGNKDAEIRDVIAYDKDGKEKYVFESGEYIKFRIIFKLNEKIKYLNAGLTINDVISNQELLSANTFLDNYKINVKKDYIDIVFEKIPLRFGEYYINASIFGDKLQPKYDYWCKIKNVKLIKKYVDDKYSGIILSNYKWL
ncbi:MAG: polysaccharide ABC transporter ATP-binding protein, ABC-2 type transport system ATP-binding protein [Candidatus Peregrinibacteria bacterium GW2011_GWF2_33_10]|nr:MAG: polysaccharide ABC transporter ATP-binding protein, ABC-2 type transport system ATP-binding protein [Candidatus Peregrinibacteria bacterium GW2011_GWF2_33_10]